VLIVEDEFLVRMIAADSLSESGFTVLEAQDAEAVLDLLERNQVAVLFTDVNMPGPINGLELVEIVSTRRPEVKVVVTSGREWIDESCLPDSGSTCSSLTSRPSLPRQSARKRGIERADCGAVAVPPHLLRHRRLGARLARSLCCGTRRPPLLRRAPARAGPAAPLVAEEGGIDAGPDRARTDQPKHPPQRRDALDRMTRAPRRIGHGSAEGGILLVRRRISVRHTARLDVRHNNSPSCSRGCESSRNSARAVFRVPGGMWWLGDPSRRHRAPTL
jgi:CheY-like chemotaxis protein